MKVESKKTTIGKGIGFTSSEESGKAIPQPFGFAFKS